MAVSPDTSVCLSGANFRDSVQLNASGVANYVWSPSSSLNAFNIATGVLIYIAQTFTVGGSIIGASAYFKSKWMEFDTRANSVITDKVNEIGAKISNKQDK